MSGALTETRQKFLDPTINKGLYRKGAIHVLDVCVGMGYNTACLMQALNKTNKNIIWWGLEIDQRPISISVNNNKFLSLWSKEVQGVLKSLERNSSWINNKGSGTLLWGDARQTVKLLPENIDFDLIFHDAFSPCKCPMLWSEEFLYVLAERIKPGGQLQTYSSAAAIRASLQRAGLEINSIKPGGSDTQKWSVGTTAKAIKKGPQKPSEDYLIRNLSLMEREHLLTKAAVPYRDPLMNRNIQQILSYRKEEQRKSKLETTSQWKMRWQNMPESITSEPQRNN